MINYCYGQTRQELAKDWIQKVLKCYQTETSVVDIMCRPVLSLIGSSVITGGVKSTMTDSEVLLAFLPTKSYPEKKFNNVFENTHIASNMDEWINKYIYL